MKVVLEKLIVTSGGYYLKIGKSQIKHLNLLSYTVHSINSIEYKSQSI